MRNKLLSFFIILFFALTPLVWFRHPGFLVDGVDTNFPLNPIVWFLQRLFVWNASQNTGADASAAVSGILFHGLQAAFYKLGFSLINTEKLTFVFWLFILGFSIYYLISVIQKIYFEEIKDWKRLYIPRIFALSFYILNLYEFDVWKNVKVANLMLLIGLPLILATLLLAIYRKIGFLRTALQTLLITLLISGIGLNPSYFIVLCEAVVIVSVFCLLDKNTLRTRDYRHKINSGLLVLLLMFVASLYWVAPLALNLLGVTGDRGTSIQDLGLQDLLSGLSQNTSLLATMRLQGAWDWYERGYFNIPYVTFAASYFTNPLLILFSILIPSISFIGFYLGRKKFYVFPFIFMTILGIVLSAGVHEPFGGIYMWVSDNIPFASLFRSPWYIFSPLIVLGYSVLIFTFADEVIKRAGRRVLPNIFLAAILVINVIYCLPLIKGNIFIPNPIGPFYVKVPDYVASFEGYLNKIPNDQRMLNLPFLPSESFSWGYSGVTPLVNLFSDKGIIYPVYGSQNQSFITLVGSEISQELTSDSIHPSQKIFGILNMGYVLNKKDMSMGGAIDKDLAFSALDLSGKKTFGNWDFYPVKREYTLPLFWVPQEKISIAGSFQALPLVASFTDFNPKTQVMFAGEQNWINGNESSVFIYPQCVRCLSQNEFVPPILEDAQILPGSIFYKLVSLKEQSQMKLTTDPLARSDLELSFALKRLSEVRGLMDQEGTDRNLVLDAINNFQNTVVIAISDLKQADANKEGTNAQWTKTFDYISTFDTFLRSFESEPATFSLNLSNPLENEVVNLENIKIDIKDKLWVTTSSDEKKYLFQAPVSGNYQIFVKGYNQDPLSFNADPALSLGINIDNNNSASASAVRTDGWVDFGTVNLDRGDHKLTTILPKINNLVRSDDQSLSLSSDQFINVENILLTNLAQNYEYRLSFEYRTLQGYAPKFSLAEVNSSGSQDKELLSDKLASDQQWRSYDNVFEKDLPDNILLSFSALPDTRNGTLDEIRNLRIERNLVPNIILKQQNTVKSNVYPLITFSKVNPTRYIVNVKNAKDPYTLIFSTTFSKGWTATINGKKVNVANHFLVNGYANAWNIDKTGNYQIAINYWPQQVFTTSLELIGAVFIALLVLYSIKKYGKN